MTYKQVNLSLSEKLRKSAQEYADMYGFKNVQELATEALREKIFFDGGYDEEFTEEEVDLVESLLEKSIKSKDLVSEDELMKTLS